MVNSEIRKLARLSTFLRAYGVVSLILFPTLLIGFVLQTPLLADPTPAAAAGRLNWVINELLGAVRYGEQTRLRVAPLTVDQELAPPDLHARVLLSRVVTPRTRKGELISLVRFSSGR